MQGGAVVGRGWTQPGGRPHAEAMALAQAGDGARGATVYVTLEPCAHRSERGPACADLLVAAQPATVVVGMRDPDPRTAGRGMERLRAAGMEVREADDVTCAESLSGYLVGMREGRPFVTLKLALTADGALTQPPDQHRWITGELARAHVHARRALHDAILVGGGTWREDSPGLDVRLPGLAERSPERWVLTRGKAPPGTRKLSAPEEIAGMDGVRYLYVEGGSQTAAAFLAADLVDRLELYRAPGGNGETIAVDGLENLAADPMWTIAERRQLGSDRFTAYRRAPTRS